MVTKRILTGVKPTGNGLHLGNFFGAVKPLIELSQWNQTFFMIADLHSLTTVHDREILERNRKRVILEYFAFMPEDSEIIIFEQSRLKYHSDITWMLSSVTPYSMMLRAHSFKDSQNKNSEINMATFNYPILMAADIINFDADIVPVWKDQKQHIEFARDIAGNFNKTYWKEIFKLPEPKIDETFMTIPWTDGRKMSKSYDNFIGIFDSEKIMKKKIMSISTDSKWLEDVKDPETCNVFALIKLLASQEKQDEIAAKYRAWNYGYGHAKLELLAIILEYFKEERKRYFEFEKNYDLIREKLEKNNSYASSIVEGKYKKILEATWLS